MGGLLSALIAIVLVCFVCYIAWWCVNQMQLPQPIRVGAVILIALLGLVAALNYVHLPLRG